MRKTLTALCFGPLTLFSVMMLLESVHGRPYLIPENEFFPDKEVKNREELLMMLLNKTFDFQSPPNIGVELVHKWQELNQLEKLKEQHMRAKNAELSFLGNDVSSSHPKKRACFWKYCV
ncbi:urotensin-2B [Nannospalax galili]|uniref:urotensin-2B n=1 Tax=Nannospalax galili TaxID=1026970 RepID=UPI0004ED482F|nr:urotensin-2B [Nannospalax galili]